MTRALLTAIVLALFGVFVAAHAQSTPPKTDPQNTICLDTKDGRIVIRLRPDLAPKHAERIKALAREKFYDNVPFHRVIDGFMAQTGDGQFGNGTGGSSYPNLPAEFSNVPFRRGIVGMARKGGDDDSANSQFFIMFAEAPSLNGQYTVVGEVVSGMNVLDKIKKGEQAQNGAVSNPDKIVRVQVAADALRVANGRTGGAAEPNRSHPRDPALSPRAILYEEDPTNPKGKRYVGIATWRIESVAAAPGHAVDVAVRAEIEIPEPKVRVKWLLRRNTDKALPASHTIEITFTLPPHFPNGDISNIPGLLMKEAEQSRGVPLAGLAVQVTAGSFLIGLSSSNSDMQRNMRLLADQSWLDIPIVYGNGRRSILSVAKGTEGERVFVEAFRAWSGQSDVQSPRSDVVQTESSAEPAVSSLKLEEKHAALGLIWGSTAQELTNQGVELKQIPQNDFGASYVASNLPRALSDQETTFLSFGHDDKLCRIAVLSRAYSKDPTGQAIRHRYNELLAVLAEKYGRLFSVHRIGDSIYKEEQYFLSGINAGRSDWFSNFDTPRVTIQLGIIADDSSTGRWRIIFEEKSLMKEFGASKKEKEKGAL